MKRFDTFLFFLLLITLAFHLVSGRDHVAHWLESAYERLIILQTEEIDGVLTQFDENQKQFMATIEAVDNEKNEKMLNLLAEAYRQKGALAFVPLERPYAIVDGAGELVVNRLDERVTTVLETIKESPKQRFLVTEDEVHRYYMRYDVYSNRTFVLSENKEKYFIESVSYDRTNEWRKESFLQGFQTLDRVDVFSPLLGQLFLTTERRYPLRPEEMTDWAMEEGFVEKTLIRGGQKLEYSGFLKKRSEDEVLFVGIDKARMEETIRGIKRPIFLFFLVFFLLTLFFFAIARRLLRRYIDPLRLAGQRRIRSLYLLSGLILLFACLQGVISLQIVKNEMTELIETHLERTMDHLVDMKRDTGQATSQLSDYVVAAHRESLQLEQELFPEKVEGLILEREQAQHYLKRLYGGNYPVDDALTFVGDGHVVSIFPLDQGVHIVERPLETLPLLVMSDRLDAYYSQQYGYRLYSSKSHLEKMMPGLDKGGRVMIEGEHGPTLVKMGTHPVSGEVLTMSMELYPFLAPIVGVESALFTLLFSLGLMGLLIKVLKGWMG